MGGIMNKTNYSKNCNKNDEDMNNPCWSCTEFLFPIGCMYYENIEGDNNEKKEE